MCLLILSCFIKGFSVFDSSKKKIFSRVWNSASYIYKKNSLSFIMSCLKQTTFYHLVLLLKKLLQNVNENVHCFGYYVSHSTEDLEAKKIEKLSYLRNGGFLKVCCFGSEKLKKMNLQVFKGRS